MIPSHIFCQNSLVDIIVRIHTHERNHFFLHSLYVVHASYISASSGWNNKYSPQNICYFLCPTESLHVSSASFVFSSGHLMLRHHSELNFHRISLPSFHWYPINEKEFNCPWHVFLLAQFSKMSRFWAMVRSAFDTGAYILCARLNISYHPPLVVTGGFHIRNQIRSARTPRIEVLIGLGAKPYSTMYLGAIESKNLGVRSVACLWLTLAVSREAHGWPDVSCVSLAALVHFTMSSARLTCLRIFPLDLKTSKFSNVRLPKSHYAN